MSSILEALKKAEAESPSREPVQVRAGKLTLGVRPAPRPRRGLKRAAVAVVAVVLVTAGALWFFRSRHRVQSAANVQSYRITAPARRSTAPVRTGGTRMAEGGSAGRAGAPAARAVKPAPAPAGRPAARSAAPRAAVSSPRPQSTAPQNRPRQATAPAPPRQPAGGTAAARPGRRTAAAPVYERSSPGLTLQAIAWDPDARRRFAVVNNQIVREGQSVDGKLVERIAEDEIIVARAGKRWKIEFRID